MVEPFAAAILDVVMPGMSGIELAGTSASHRKLARFHWRS